MLRCIAFSYIQRLCTYYTNPVPIKVAFGRHETFALRYSWLTKGYQAVSKPKGNSIFSSDEA
ncbi:DUF4007 family protein, partial [Thiolapillus sp.]|uniref:DUF4007 family protein n=1 Tax=Thiolapillus sp. TaxID=2017437 RepID=UPI003AF93608